jgi:hypothetical protein
MLSASGFWSGIAFGFAAGIATTGFLGLRKVVHPVSRGLYSTRLHGEAFLETPQELKLKWEASKPSRAKREEALPTAVGAERT